MEVGERYDEEMQCPVAADKVGHGSQGAERARSPTLGLNMSSHGCLLTQRPVTVNEVGHRSCHWGSPGVPNVLGADPRTSTVVGDVSYMLWPMTHVLW
jgi:hypothetical protein